jgi:aspartyl-tRNA(Asn)/glutamyl-tRNA(Gln) amidotransferase subunit A
MEEVLRRIEGLDPAVGAIVALAEDAMDRARAADAATGPRPPLHGVPLAVKDNIDVAGMPTRAGSQATPDPPVSRDAAVVAALRRAGAIPVAKTRMPEFAYCSVTPGTANPAAPGRTPGGSSGGSAAAVAAGMVPAALGTDTGGSIRTPAALCGVVGFRPTLGLVPRDGVVPLAPSMDAVGPLATSVEDCRLVFEAIRAHRGQTGHPGVAASRPGMTRVRPGPAGVRLAVLGEIADGARADVARAFEHALEALVSAGASVERRSIGDPAEQTRALAALTALEAARVHRDADWDRSRYTPSTLAALRRGEDMTLADAETAERVRREVRAAVSGLLEEVDALIAPTVWVGAPAEEAELVDVAAGPVRRDAALLRPTSALSLAGIPVVSLPAGVDGDGFPVGLQLGGRKLWDDRLLDLAGAVESVLREDLRGGHHASIVEGGEARKGPSDGDIDAGPASSGRAR